MEIDRGKYADARTPWEDPAWRAADGHSAAELRRAAGLAWRLGQLGRAASWGRLFPDAYPSSTQVGDPERAAALLRLLDS